MKINKLKIHCSNLTEQIDFYSSTIGVTLVSHSASEAKLQVGNSELTLIKSESFQPYHFAINIPCNQETEALQWLKKRVEILRDGTDEIQDFDSWNAKAIYFYDADKNIVEFISRKTLKNESEEKFGFASLLEISEIGVPVSDIEKTYGELNAIVELNVYDGGFERFCAIGDEHGLFICIDKQLKDWYPTGDKAHSSAFEIEFTEKESAYHMEFKNGRLKTIK